MCLGQGGAALSILKVRGRANERSPRGRSKIGGAMSPSRIRRYSALVLCCVAASVAAVLPAPSPGAVRAVRAPATKLPSQLLFVPSETGTIQIYGLKNLSKPLAQISGLQAYQDQMVVDAHGDLFVVNNGPYGNDDYVSEYAPPYNSAPTILNTVWQGETFYPVGVTVDANGTVYVTNWGAGVGETPEIFEYPAGATSPATAVTSPLLGSLGGMSLDRNGNVYVLNEDPDSLGADVFKLKPGSKKPIPLGLRGLLGIIRNSVAIDAEGDLYVSSAVTSDYVLEYQAGKTEPFRVIDRASWFQSGPLKLAVGPDDNVYVPVACTDSQCPEVYAYGPHGNQPLEQIGSQVFSAEGTMSVALAPNIALQGSARTRPLSRRPQ
jgi:hypothetical protein